MTAHKVLAKELDEYCLSLSKMLRFGAMTVTTEDGPCRAKYVKLGLKAWYKSVSPIRYAESEHTWHVELGQYLKDRKGIKMMFENEVRIEKRRTAVQKLLDGGGGYGDKVPSYQGTP